MRHCSYTPEFLYQMAKPDRILFHTDNNVKVKTDMTLKLLNPLRANFFQKEQKHIFTFHVIPPHQYHGCWCPGHKEAGHQHPWYFLCWTKLIRSLHVKGTFTHAWADVGGKLVSTQIITCVHTCAVVERRRSGSKNRSARNGSNTQFTAPASKPHTPNHHCPQEMADPPASAPRMCEHTRGSGAGISKSARLRSATAQRMCEHSFRV